MTRGGWLAAALPVLPGVAGLLGLLVRQDARRTAARLAIGATGLALLASLWLAFDVVGRPAGSPPVDDAATLADFGSLLVTVGVRVDSVAALVAVAVCAVAFAVQVYSTAYLDASFYAGNDGRLRRDGGDRYAPYAAQVSLFTAAMLLVVVSGDLVTLLVGWEVMGLCSYLLIGHDRRLPEAPGAAVKAFLVTRVGDVGFALGVVVLGVGVGSFRIADVVAEAPGRLSPAMLTAACLLLLGGVAGKSAQFPLHTWLPDAMAGPTPISALIHAATMVAAGVYVVARLYPLYLTSPTAMAVLAVLAAVTMVLGACAALAQDDLKRVLAWSTVSQLAYMAGALAVGSAPAALFHLLTHAAFKALLFLAAGAVIHAVATNAMSAMGGLRRGMPVTFWTMTIGLGALVGLPPLAGFWSKESVLTAAERATHGDGPGAVWTGWLVLVAGLATVVLTAAYVARLWLRTFFGARRGEATALHDPPGAMRWPLALLAVPAALLGLAALWPDALPAWLGARSGGREWGFTDTGAYHEGTLPSTSLAPEATTTLLALACATVGALAVYLVWRRAPAADPARMLGPLRRPFEAAFYVDAAQDALIVRPVQALARAVLAADTRGVDGLVEGAGRGASGLGRVLAVAHATGLGRYVTAAVAGGALLAAGAALANGLLP